MQKLMTIALAGFANAAIGIQAVYADCIDLKFYNEKPAKPSGIDRRQ
jgi:hypothetical protein